MVTESSWAAKAIKRVETDRGVDGLPVEDFGWLHLPCGDDVVTETEIKNSSQIDPATGDPKPIFSTNFYCRRHKVRSEVIETQGQ